MILYGDTFGVRIGVKCGMYTSLSLSLSLSFCVCVYVYVYINIYMNTNIFLSLCLSLSLSLSLSRYHQGIREIREMRGILWEPLSMKQRQSVSGRVSGSDSGSTSSIKGEETSIDTSQHTQHSQHTHTSPINTHSQLQQALSSSPSYDHTYVRK